MTPGERRNPKIINGSRRARIAAGSGVTVGEVNNLIVRFLEGQKMMRQMMGSMPGFGGARRAQKARGKNKKKGKGGGRPPGAGRTAPGGAGAGSRPAAEPALSDLADQLNGNLPGGLSGLPGLDGKDSPLKFPPAGPGGLTGPSNLPPAFRGRPGKKGR